MGNERAGQSKYGPITEDEVNAAQTAWCDALITIGQVYSAGGNYEAVADRLIDDLYDYKEGTVFFKPTLAFGRNAFRSTKEGALSYFIAGNPNFPEDRGLRAEALGEGALRQQRGGKRHPDPRRHRHHDGQLLSD
jgi:hypothetical protein